MQLQNNWTDTYLPVEVIADGSRTNFSPTFGAIKAEHIKVFSVANNEATDITNTATVTLTARGGIPTVEFATAPTANTVIYVTLLGLKSDLSNINLVGPVYNATANEEANDLLACALAVYSYHAEHGLPVTNPYQFDWLVKGADDLGIPTPSLPNGGAVVSTGTSGITLPLVPKQVPPANAGRAIYNRKFITLPEGFVNFRTSTLSGVGYIEFYAETTHHLAEIGAGPDIITSSRKSTQQLVVGRNRIALANFLSVVPLTGTGTPPNPAITMELKISFFNNSGSRVAGMISNLEYNKVGVWFHQLANNRGKQGDKGEKGDRGEGVPAGGTTGQVVTKTATGTAWETPDPAGDTNVQADFNESDNTSHAYIRNKPAANRYVPTDGVAGNHEGRVLVETFNGTTVAPEFRDTIMYVATETTAFPRPLMKGGTLVIQGGTNAGWWKIGTPQAQGSNFTQIANNAKQKFGGGGSGTVADGSITADKLANNAVTTPKIDRSAVTRAKLGTDFLNEFDNKHGLYPVHPSAVGVWRGVSSNPMDDTVLSGGTTQFDGGAIYLSRTDATGRNISVDDLPAVGGAITFAEITTTVAAKEQNSNRIKLTLAGSNQPLAGQGIKYSLFNVANPTINLHGIYVKGALTGSGDPAEAADVRNGGIDTDRLAENAVTQDKIADRAVDYDQLDTTLRSNIQANNNKVGIPSGGTQGQVLKKSSNADHDATWQADNAGTSINNLTDIGDIPALPSANGEYYLKATKNGNTITFTWVTATNADKILGAAWDPLPTS